MTKLKIDPVSIQPPSLYRWPSCVGGEAEGDAQAEVQPAEGRDGRDGEAKEQTRGADERGKQQSDSYGGMYDSDIAGTNLYFYID